MSKIAKSQLTVDGNHIQMSVPFGKVDKENRLVSGFATLNNLDTQGDVVLAEASRAAFKAARGNIREMHQPIAVGKIVNFEEKDYFDADSGEMYTGIYVTSYVSKGAQDTWEKVLDETLTGFSIGGEITEADNEFVKEAGKTVRFIKGYDLTELSLVDNPANQLANVFSIQKSAGGNSFVKGMMSTTFIENVFVCKNDETVIVKDSAKEDCPTCGLAMENAGWFESGENRVDKVSSIVSDFWNPAETEAAPISESEGGVVEMGRKNEEVTKSETKPEEVEETTPTVEEEPVEVEEVETEEESATEVSETEEAPAEEEAAEVVEVEDEGEEIAKRFDELHEAITHSLDATKAETAERVAALEKVVAEATQEFMAKASEIEGKINGLVENVTTTKAALAAMEARVEKMNSSDAIRKSAELDNDSAEKNVQSNSLWNGAFSPGPRRSTYSVDDM